MACCCSIHILLGGITALIIHCSIRSQLSKDQGSSFIQIRRENGYNLAVACFRASGVTSYKFFEAYATEQRSILWKGLRLYPEAALMRPAATINRLADM
jgi:hypothetical protein